jgi:hypothetical protein
LRLDPHRQYDLPAVFGPSPFPDVTAMGSVQTLSVPFVTQRDAMAELLPPAFEPADEPVVTVAHTMNRDIDYMGGRGYNIVRVAFSAVFRGQEETLVAPYAPVIWESDAAPIILGRERGGYAKIFGRIPDLRREGDEAEFECYEYEARLLHAKVERLSPVGDDVLTEIRRAAANSVSLGWKYIPGIGGQADVDYPLALPAHYSYDAAWRGEGTVTFDTDGAREAPYSGHIIPALAALPVTASRPATLVQGSMKLPRNEARRLR